VFGGGGITPDLLLPYRKDESFVYYNALVNQRLINRVAFRQVRRHAASLLQRYPTAKAFGRGYTVPDSVIEELVCEGEKRGIARNAKSLAIQKKLIVAGIKANIGQCLYGNDAFYDAYLPMDEDLNRIKNIKIELK
jgi:carboxyl-terminal processing protease